MSEIGFRKTKAAKPKAVIPQTGQITVSRNNPWSSVKGGDLRYTSGFSARKLDDIYKNVSIIRAIIDGIARTVSSLGWNIVGKDQNKPTPELHIKKTKEFFERK